MIDAENKVRLEMLIEGLHASGAGLVNGPDPASDSRMKNGSGLTHGVGLVNGSWPFHRFRQNHERGLTNQSQIKEAGGLEARVDLINGFSIEPKGISEDSPSGWGRSARKRRAARKALSLKSAMPLPGKRSAT